MKATEDAHTPADMVGNLTATAAFLSIVPERVICMLLRE